MGERGWEAGENDDVSEDDDAETGEEVVADDADTNEDVEKEEHELVQALGIGCYSTGARPGDWRVGDVILLKRYVLQPGVVEPSRPAASTRKDGYEEASKTDEWFRVYHPDPIEPNQVDEVVIPDT